KNISFTRSSNKRLCILYTIIFFLGLASKKDKNQEHNAEISVYRIDHKYFFNNNFLSLMNKQE
ncbi:MAG: hypothetical protein EAZ07_10250, partial [Cytophagales bacterium]